MKPNTKRSRFPQYVIFVTNVRLSAQDGTGGLIRSICMPATNWITTTARPDHQPRTLRERGLREVKNLASRLLERGYLERNADVRAAFPMLLTVGDMLTRASRCLDSSMRSSLQRFWLTMPRPRSAKSNGCVLMRRRFRLKPQTGRSG